MTPLILFQLILTKLTHSTTIHSSGPKKPTLNQIESQWERK